jgi:protein TonB
MALPAFSVPATSGEMVFVEADLDQPPAPIVRTQPPYPYKARHRGIEGEVTVKFLVQTDGTVTRVEIVSASPQGLFEDAVTDAVVKWRFEPGRIAGQPVAAWVVNTIVFDMDQ